jgi:hypothetical protein
VALNTIKQTNKNKKTGVNLAAMEGVVHLWDIKFNLHNLDLGTSSVNSQVQ